MSIDTSSRPDPKETLDKRLTPDFSSPVTAIPAIGILAAAGIAGMSGMFSLALAGLTVGITLASFLAYPKWDKGSKGYALLAAGSAAAAFLAPAAALGLGMVAAMAAGASYMSQRGAQRAVCEAEAAQEREHVEQARRLEKAFSRDTLQDELDLPEKNARQWQQSVTRPSSPSPAITR